MYVYVLLCRGLWRKREEKWFYDQFTEKFGLYRRGIRSEENFCHFRFSFVFWLVF